MAKVHILLYRQWDIYFSTESERFIVENGVNEIQKDKPSFAAACAFVDAFIKENLVFEPFEVEQVDYKGQVKQRATVIGIRKNGRFVIESKRGEKEQVPEWNEKDWIISSPQNEPIRVEMAAIDAEIAAVVLPLNKRLDALKEKLACVTLADRKRGERYADWVDIKERNRFGSE